MKIFMNRRELPEHEQDYLQQIGWWYLTDKTATHVHTVDTATLAKLFSKEAELITRGGLRLEVTEHDVDHFANRNIGYVPAGDDGADDDEPAEGQISDEPEDEDEMGNAL